MNSLQKTEFEILRCFTKICEKLGIKYFLVCGSALGAVKYKGFIPWDDDIDVALYRADYEKFIIEAPKLLPSNLFLQNYKSEHGFPCIYSKLRNSDTAFIERSAAKLNINHGINIDIFPLDNYPDNSKEAKIFELKKTVYKRLLSTAYEPDSKWKMLFILPLRILNIHKKSDKIIKKYEKLITSYNTCNTDIIANHGNWQGKLDYSPREIFADGTMAEFEGIEVIIPYKYDEYLRQKYGDYHIDPPLSQQKSHHNCAVIDCENSYKKYIGDNV